MNKYDRLVQEIVEFSGLRVEGSTDEDIISAEKQVGKRIPEALKAWYRAVGKKPLFTGDYDMDYSLRDFLESQTVAEELAGCEDSQFKLTEHTLPFSQRIYEMVHFVDTQLGNPDDPPVFWTLDGYEPEQISVAFSARVREHQLSRHALWVSDKDKSISPSVWLSRKGFFLSLRKETINFRQELIEEIHIQDLTSNNIIGPREFQEIWIERFSKTDTFKVYQENQLIVPYFWVERPTLENIETILQPPHKP